jgi:hypothetical protein
LTGSSEPDFAALRAERDAAVEAVIAGICTEQGWERGDVRVSINPGGCYCACPSGPCEHKFEGWRAFDDGLGGEAVCACGMGAASHDLMVCE